MFKSFFILLFITQFTLAFSDKRRNEALINISAMNNSLNRIDCQSFSAENCPSLFCYVAINGQCFNVEEKGPSFKNKKDDSGLSAGAIAGIIIGAFFFLLIVFFVVLMVLFFCGFTNRRRH